MVLVAKTAEEQIRQDLLIDQAADLRWTYDVITYALHITDEEFKRPKDGFLKVLPTTLRTVSEFLGEKEWFTGKNLNIVDFIIYELLGIHRAFVPTCLNDFEYLQTFLFCPLIAIFTPNNLLNSGKYLASDKFMNVPIQNKMARFGST
ncbi:PREDICTED: glutathione S-transferase Mu 1-like [Priapulus caudatus]|uniref:Glutathione S-transferase Mu 1-like n=1 Tax=Priapulus caudatus TaxID=37621 RepID=A0ABM1DRI0_PRICU|nr:PREDICTED: glutathione S-transferase Mu 1-like [Priapulus caudatus]